MARRSYDQYCPIAEALDLLGERWTLLILRELLGGARRYTDLRQALPGVATSLLASRLRQLVTVGLAEQVDVPPPVAAAGGPLAQLARGLNGHLPADRRTVAFCLPFGRDLGGWGWQAIGRGEAVVSFLALKASKFGEFARPYGLGRELAR